MDCHHGHHHAHHYHQHAGLAEGIPQEHVQRLRLVMGLSLGYMLLQFFGGYFSGSLALMAEATHKLGDASAIALALVAAWLASLPATDRQTFGYGRMEIMAALINGLILIGVSTMIIHEAWERATGIATHGHHHHIEGGLMLIVACFGMAINLWAAKILHPSRDKSLNVKGAYLHVMTDLAGSLGTLITSVLILLYHWQWVDLLLSALIALLVFRNAFHILAEALHVFMEASPRHLDVHALERFLLSLPQVRSIHDLHVWTITTGKNAILTHVVVEPEAFLPETAGALEEQLRKAYGFCHITVQLEPQGFQEQTIPF